MTGSTTTTRESQAAADEALLTIGGHRQPGAAGNYPIHNPARPAEIVGHAPAADSAQLDAAVSAARRAAPGWRAL
ncbi:MAG TPA: aldehyde dehydrogenase, partial [Mycobacterium sp.]|nr:aldehyde dehydrogenase [Mycobacterium sp.]